MDKPKLGLEHSMKLLKSVGLIGCGTLKMFDNGKLDLGDLGVLASMAADAGEIIDGFDDLDLVLAEVRDLDIEEMKVLIEELLTVFVMLKAAKA